MLRTEKVKALGPNEGCPGGLRLISCSAAFQFIAHVMSPNRLGVAKLGVIEGGVECVVEVDADQ